ncbi:MAG: DUF4468 domain-containing protein [Bacteroidetes bacterium]|nr:DUF4468 domain-containing protein [Bacteroidota bacterium]
MKKSTLFIIGVMCMHLAGAQSDQLQLNEHNKYVFYQVVDLTDVSVDSLHNNSLLFVKAYYPKNKSVQSSDTSISLKSKFLLYSAISLARHESGEMAFSLHIECRNSKYRFWLTDFVFTPYERNRYAVFVPVPGKEIGLEKALAKIDKAELDGYFTQTAIFCRQLGEQLKQYMSESHHERMTPKKSLPPKISTGKW